MKSMGLMTSARWALSAWIIALLAGCGNNDSGGIAVAPIAVQGESFMSESPAEAESPKAEVTAETKQTDQDIPKEVAALPAVPAPEPGGTDYVFSKPKMPEDRATTPTVAPTVGADGVLNLTWADLGGWDYQFPSDADLAKVAPEAAPSLEKFPENIRKMNGQKIRIEGFMIPSDVVDGKIKGFVLLKSQMGCCFGVMPLMNEWIYVTMAGDKTVDYMPDILLSTTGVLEMGEQVREGTVVSIYRMQGEAAEPIKTKYSWTQGY